MAVNYLIEKQASQCQCRLQTQELRCSGFDLDCRALHTIISFNLALIEQTAQAGAGAEPAFAFSICSLTFSLCVRCKLKNHRAAAEAASAAAAAIEINNRRGCHLVAGSVLLPSKLILRQRAANCFRQASAVAAQLRWQHHLLLAALSGSGSSSGTKRRIFWHAEANKFLAVAATAVTLLLVVVIAADAKSCLLNSGNGNANSRTKGQSERGESGRGRVRGKGRGREGIFERGPVPQMCKSN